MPGDGTEKPKGRDDAKWKNIPLDNERFCNYYKVRPALVCCYDGADASAAAGDRAGG